MSLSRRVPVLCLSLLLGVCRLLAQSGLGSITGTVVDPTGGIIAGATVRLTQTTTQVSRTTTANDAGLFTFPAVVVGLHGDCQPAGIQGTKDRKPEHERFPAVGARPDHA